MKKGVVFAILLTAILLAGCSRNNGNNQPASTVTPVPQNQEISNIDPTLTQDGFIRVQLTDPALYDYLQKQGMYSVSSNTGTVSAEDQRKIGRTVAFRKVMKYGIAGSATVISATRIQVGQFTYNGGCGPIKLGLIINNKPTNSLATVKEIGAAVNASQFNIDIPTNLSLSKFDSIAVFCTDSPDPVSTADFSGI